MKYKKSSKEDLTVSKTCQCLFSTSKTCQCLIFLLLSLSVSAQKHKGFNKPIVPHELAVHAGGGYSSLQYSLTTGNATGGYGGDVGLDYTHFFTKRWGVGAGIGVAMYSASAVLDGSTFVSPLIDGLMDVYELHTSLDSYKEQQRALMATIPILLHYQTDLHHQTSNKLRGSSHQFYVRGGIKLSIPVSASYTVNNAALTNVRYYPNQDVILGDQPLEGLGTFTRSFNGSLSLKPACAATIETGIKWRRGENVWLYTGIYIDYGLTGSNPSELSDFFLDVPESDPSIFTTRSVLATQQSGVNMAGKLSTLSVGVNFRIAFGYPTDGGNRLWWRSRGGRDGLKANQKKQEQR